MAQYPWYCASPTRFHFAILSICFQNSSRWRWNPPRHRLLWNNWYFWRGFRVGPMITFVWFGYRWNPFSVLQGLFEFWHSLHLLPKFLQMTPKSPSTLITKESSQSRWRRPNASSKPSGQSSEGQPEQRCQSGLASTSWAGIPSTLSTPSPGWGIGGIIFVSCWLFCWYSFRASWIYEGFMRFDWTSQRPGFITLDT